VNKKVYRKPALLMERFSLTQMLASCTLKIAFSDSICVMNDPDATEDMKSFAHAGVFMEGCIASPEGIEFDDAICYHNSVNIAFTS